MSESDLQRWTGVARPHKNVEDVDYTSTVVPAEHFDELLRVNAPAQPSSALTDAARLLHQSVIRD